MAKLSLTQTVSIHTVVCGNTAQCRQARYQSISSPASELGIPSREPLGRRDNLGLNNAIMAKALENSPARMCRFDTS